MTKRFILTILKRCGSVALSPFMLYAAIPPPTHRTFPILQNGKSVPLDDSLFPLPSAPGHHRSPFLSLKGDKKGEWSPVPALGLS